jgi:hypothetical protein
MVTLRVCEIKEKRQNLGVPLTISKSLKHVKWMIYRDSGHVLTSSMPCYSHMDHEIIGGETAGAVVG